MADLHVLLCWHQAALVVVAALWLLGWVRARVQVRPLALVLEQQPVQCQCMAPWLHS